MIRTHTIIYATQSKTFKGRKFVYEYQFRSFRSKYRLRGLEVTHYGKIYDFQRHARKQHVTIVCLYPGTERNSFCNNPLKRSLLLSKTDLPSDIRNLRKRSKIKIPTEIIKAVSKRTKLNFDNILSKS